MNNLLKNKSAESLRETAIEASKNEIDGITKRIENGASKGYLSLYIGYMTEGAIQHFKNNGFSVSNGTISW